MIRAAQASDVSDIMGLETHFPAGQRWSSRTWEAELAADDRKGFVAIDGDVIGVALFQSTFEVADLHRIVVAPQWRRRGLASRLLDAGHAWAHSRGAERAMLEVRPDNQAAIAMYERDGYHRIGARRDYYAPGVDCLVMERQLAAEQPQGTEKTDE